MLHMGDSTWKLPRIADRNEINDVLVIVNRFLTPSWHKFPALVAGKKQKSIRTVHGLQMFAYIFDIVSDPFIGD